MIKNNGIYNFIKKNKLGKTVTVYIIGWTFLQLIRSINDLVSEWIIRDVSEQEYITKKKDIYKNLINFIMVIIISVIILNILKF